MSPDARFCPNCGSTHVEPDSSNSAEIAFSGGNPNKWSCRKCGYTGMMPEHAEAETGDEVPESLLNPEEDGEAEQEISFEPNEEYPREDLGFGRGYLKYLLYISLPAVVIYYGYRLLIQS